MNSELRNLANSLSEASSLTALAVHSTGTAARPHSSLAGADFWHSTLDSLNARVAVLDEHGAIVAANEAWRRFAAESQTQLNACIGANYLTICDKVPGDEGEQAAAAAVGIRSVLTGRCDHFSLPYLCSGDSQRWFLLRATRFEGTSPARVVIAYENVTPLKIAEIRAAEQAGKLEAANAALRKEITDLQRAEALEADRNQILELIARNELLTAVLHQIALLVQKQQPELVCAVVLSGKAGIEISSAPDYTPKVRTDLEARLAAAMIASGGNPGLVAQVVDAERFPGGRTACARSAQKPAQFRLVPIRSQLGSVAGWLAVTHTSGEGTPAHSVMLDRAASLASIAVDYAGLFGKLAFQAHHDSVTELPNRILFQERLQQVMSHSRRENRGFAVLMLDLDRFKQVNDVNGHHIGDTLLRQVAQRILQCVRTEDTVARLGSDEFAIILGDVDSRRHAEKVAQRIVTSFQTPFCVAGREFAVTCSIGMSLFPQDARDEASLVRTADAALYECKKLGRNISKWFDATAGNLAMERAEIECHLHEAVQNDELVLHYQPQLDMRGRVVGVEALLRWNSPVLGFIPPGKFIPVAEESGLIVDIGNWALRHACAQSVEWQRKGFPPVRMSVNVSSIQLIRPDFAQVVASVLAETGLDSNLLELEVTETAMMHNMGGAVGEIEKLHAMGVRISIDDFGTGYSSLNYIQNLPVDAVKIDRSFIRELDGPSQNAASVVQAIITLAHGLSLTVVAEGVETSAQYETVSALNCDLAQGYLLHRPLTLKDVEQVLRAASGLDD